MSRQTVVDTKKQSTSYAFVGNDENVYGAYVNTVFVRRYRLLWLLAGLLFLVLFCSSLYIIMHPQVLNDLLDSSVRKPSPRTVLSASLGLPISWLFILCSIFLIPLAFIPLTRWGCTFGNFAWPRFYAWQCRISKRGHYFEYGQAYFENRERHPMEATIGERSVRIAEKDGSTRVFALRSAKRSYRGNGLVVLESGSKYAPTSEVILDVSNMSLRERMRFYRTLDARLPQDCVCYHVRLSRSKVGARKQTSEEETSL